MNKVLLGATVALALVSMPTPAHATPSMWVQCDGQPRPEGAATTAARIAAVILIPGLGLLAAGETGGAPAVGQPGIDACTQALADPALDQFWQRKISILRSRAVHYVEIQNYDAALTDLTAMSGVAHGQDAAPLFQRSVGVSAQLMEAALRARSGDLAHARELAITAADQRPYSLSVQTLARSFFVGQPSVSADELRVLQREARYDSTIGLHFPYRLDQTDDVQAAADAWEASLAAGDHTSAHGLDRALERKASDPADAVTLLRAAIAMARAGRIERAEALKAQADEALGPEDAPAANSAAGEATLSAPEADAPPAAASQSNVEARRTQLRTQINDIIRTQAAPYRPLLRAMLMSAHGDDAGALAVVQAHFDSLPKIMASAELLQHLSQDPHIGAQVPAFLIQSATTAARPDLSEKFRQMRMLDWVHALPQFDRVDGGQRYRPGSGVGYREISTDDGDTRIVYSGAPSVYALSEMLLLRAAQLAEDHHTDAFLITDIDGAWIDVAFVDSANPPPEYAHRAARFIRAADVIDNLGAIYIDIPAQEEALRHGNR